MVQVEEIELLIAEFANKIFSSSFPGKIMLNICLLMFSRLFRKFISKNFTKTGVNYIYLKE